MAPGLRGQRRREGGRSPGDAGLVLEVDYIREYQRILMSSRSRLSKCCHRCYADEPPPMPSVGLKVGVGVGADTAHCPALQIGKVSVQSASESQE